MRFSKQSSPIQIKMDQNQLQNLEYFSYFGSMITTEANFTREIKSRIVIVKAAFNKKTLLPPVWTYI